MFSKKHFKITYKTLLVLIIINIFYAFFLYQREYNPVKIEIDITSDYQSWVWLSHKGKYNDSIYLSTKEFISKKKKHTLIVEIDNKYGSEFIGINWNFSDKGKFFIHNIRFKNKSKIKEYSNPEEVVKYISNNLNLVKTKDGVYAESKISANGWIMLETFPIYKISRVKSFHPISFSINCFLFLLIYLIIYRYVNQGYSFYKQLTIEGNIYQKMRTYILVLWALLLPFWINISHILAIVLFVIFSIHFFNKKEDFKVSKMKSFWIFPLFFLSIIAVNFIFHFESAFDDLVRFSYFIIAPILFVGLPKKNIKNIITSNQISIIGYVILLIVATTERYFNVNNSLSFELVFVNTIETYWHTSYLAGLLMLNMFVYLINTKQKIFPIILSIIVLSFIYFSDARLSFIMGILLFFIIQIKKQFNLKRSKRIFLITAIFLILGILFLANNKGSKEYFINSLFKTKSEKTDARINLWESSKKVIGDHYLWGVGNNHIKSSLSSNLDIDSKIKYRDYNAHNQYLEILIGYGIFPLLFFILLIIYPVLNNKLFIFNMFILYFSIAMLVESYLARQAGVIIFTYWYCLLIVYNEKN